MQRIAEYRNSWDGLLALVDLGPRGFVVSLYDLDADGSLVGAVTFAARYKALAYALKCVEG